MLAARLTWGTTVDWRYIKLACPMWVEALKILPKRNVSSERREYSFSLSLSLSTPFRQLSALMVKHLRRTHCWPLCPFRSFFCWQSARLCEMKPIRRWSRYPVSCHNFKRRFRYPTCTSSRVWTFCFSPSSYLLTKIALPHFEIVYTKHLPSFHRCFFIFSFFLFFFSVSMYK